MDRLLFLDVDGVLNPFLARTNLHGDWKKVDFADGGRYWISASLGRWLSELSDSGTTVVWATTWVHHPEDLQRYVELIGAPSSFERIRFDPAVGLSSLGESGKCEGVAEWLAAHRPSCERRVVVWVDDDIGPHDRAFAEAEGIAVFTPQPASGLSDSRLRGAIAAILS